MSRRIQDEREGRSWYDLFGPKAVPETNAARAARSLAPELFSQLALYWRDPEIGPWMGAFLAEQGIIPAESYLGELLSEEGWQDAPLQPDEWLFPAPPMANSLIADIVYAVSQSEAVGELVPDGVAISLLEHMLAVGIEDETGEKPRLFLVSKEQAAAFIQAHHSKLPYLNYRGLLYTLGVRTGQFLHAVATVNTPTAPFKRPGCPVEGIIELTRVASDGTLKGASSMIAARCIDLLPVSGRRGASGCLFTTYSLTSEAGTTYLALVDKGLRPTAKIHGKKPGGSRAGSTEALGTEPKIVWEAGPAAKPADWSVLRGIVPDERIEAAAKRLEDWERRNRQRR